MPLMKSSTLRASARMSFALPKSFAKFAKKNGLEPFHFAEFSLRELSRSEIIEEISKEYKKTFDTHDAR